MLILGVTRRSHRWHIIIMLLLNSDLLLTLLLLCVSVGAVIDSTFLFSPAVNIHMGKLLLSAYDIYAHACYPRCNKIVLLVTGLMLI